MSYRNVLDETIARYSTQEQILAWNNATTRTEIEHEIKRQVSRHQKTDEPVDTGLDDEFKHCIALVDVLEREYYACDTGCEGGYEIIELLKKSLAIRAQITPEMYLSAAVTKLEEKIEEAHQELDTLAKIYGVTL